MTWQGENEKCKLGEEQLFDWTTSEKLSSDLVPLTVHNTLVFESKNMSHRWPTIIASFYRASMLNPEYSFFCDLVHCPDRKKKILSESTTLPFPRLLRCYSTTNTGLDRCSPYIKSSFIMLSPSHCIQPIVVSKQICSNQFSVYSLSGLCWKIL